ncbi:hypothetical protein B0H14DRAFT_3506701 [Mycena olivaceomarginata]|nr:hypothetical protein B0H14DRAFT_3506701 [Mycena olivaceomarginata]
MSLKCPLSFMRINTPCRSAKCTHLAVLRRDVVILHDGSYDDLTGLLSGYASCAENVLDWRELIMTGTYFSWSSPANQPSPLHRFFAEILKTTSDSVDDVLVEADGEWSTADGKYSSASAAKVADGARYDYIDCDSD